MLKRIVLIIAGMLFFCSMFTQASVRKAPSKVLVTEAMENRIRVLYIAGGIPLRDYPQIDFLERNTDLRFEYQRRSNPEANGDGEPQICDRSEERRVGKECRSRWSPYQ